ncbi:MULTISPECIES: type III secretion system cytoplasmic ring protein SctQ [Rhizobium]|uniref:Type III secretion protein n=2 Tax=Rhizobium TaxID=379 RepID=A0A179C0X9_RHILE|nr:type III secretion system cytoplasmic ring protein SctQ [Rhizobium leguminosarum]ANP90528.1 type III secretion protein [Rhizobium leguminosarum]API56744.1 type III secretion protein [Rhizobium leguminosarum]OAP97033.1 type III secretion protein [Rhizobium leguminosarum]
MNAAFDHLSPMGLHSGHGIPQALEAWRIPFGGGMLAIRPLAPDIATDRMENPARLGLTMAGEPVELLAPGATLKLIVDRLEPLAQWDRLSPPACAAVLEYLLSDVLERVETQIGGQIALTDVGPAAPRELPGNFGFELTWQGLSLPLYGHFPEPMLMGLRRWANRLPRRQLAALTAEIAIRRGYAVLSASELKQLSVGDGILIDPMADENAIAVTGEHFLAACTLSNEGATLSGPLLTRPNGPMRHFMSNETIDQDLREAPTIASIGDIPVKLVFDIARIELPLSELESIAEGHVFPLDRPKQDAVEIVAQGRIIGRGEIVTLDGLTAVRVTALHA